MKHTTKSYPTLHKVHFESMKKSCDNTLVIDSSYLVSKPGAVLVDVHTTCRYYHLFLLVAPNSCIHSRAPRCTQKSNSFVVCPCQSQTVPVHKASETSAFIAPSPSIITIQITQLCSTQHTNIYPCLFNFILAPSPAPISYLLSSLYPNRLLQ